MERIAVVALLLAIVGCDHHRYEIVVQPQGEVFGRQVSVEFGDKDDQGDWSAKPIPPETLGRLEQLHQQKLTPSDEARQVFTGMFDKVPADLGGSGSYLYLTSPMGDGTLYIERFPGRLNQAEAVQQAFAAADELTDLLIGWFEQQPDVVQSAAAIRDLLDNQIRQDLKNLSLLAWTSQMISAEGWLEPEQLVQLLTVRAGQYLVERGYIKPRELPELVRAVQESSDSRWSQRLLEMIRRRVVSMAGLSANQAEELDVLRDADHAAASMANYLTTREVDVTDIAERLLPLGLEGASDDKVVLHVTVSAQPIMTNGQYDPDTMTVTWSRSFSPDKESDSRMAPLAYAVWVHPNEAYQLEQMGAVLLKDQDLAQYLLWYSALTEAESQEWNDFIASLRGEDDLPEQLQFRFSHEKNSFKSHADWPLELIRRATSRK